MPSDEVTDLVELAEKMALEAGALARDRRSAVERMPVATTKSSPTDVVTASDTAVERLIRSRIQEARPDDAVVGEEDGHSAGKSGVAWVVDPIDGTVNYMYGIPQYAVSIAVQVDGVVEAGVVHNPVSAESWTAVRGQGARLDGRPIRVSNCSDLSVALVATGFAYFPDRRARQGRILAELLPLIRDVRRGGAAALELTAVACGRLDGYYERGLQPWDYAAGALIAAEAGAVVGGLHGADVSTDMTIAASPAIAPVLRDHLERLHADWPA